jgi:hypothetical protein
VRHPAGYDLRPGHRPRRRRLCFSGGGAAVEDGEAVPHEPLRSGRRRRPKSLARSRSRGRPAKSARATSCRRPDPRLAVAQGQWRVRATPDARNPASAPTKKKPRRHSPAGLTFGAPRRIRTSGPRIRSPILYPAELWAHSDSLQCFRAEREGFEPSIQVVPVYWFSKPAPSAARPSLQRIAARQPGSMQLSAGWASSRSHQPKERPLIASLDWLVKPFATHLSLFGGGRIRTFGTPHGILRFSRPLP